MLFPWPERPKLQQPAGSAPGPGRKFIWQPRRAAGETPNAHAKKLRRLHCVLRGFPGDLVVLYAEVNLLAGEDFAFEYCC